MELIQLDEISAKIMTLINDAEKELIIVSPYNKIDGWNKLINRIKKAQARKVKISWYSRNNNVDKNNAKEVRKLGIEPILIDNLHAKLYMNEKSAIVTSMNMSKISDDQSIEIGLITKNEKEFEDIYTYFIKHIKNSNPVLRKTNIQDDIKEDKTSKRDIEQDKISSESYINRIHTHINNKYGQFDYKLTKNQNKLPLLEYPNFRKKDFTLQLDSFDQAIKIKIFIPKDKRSKKLINAIYNCNDISLKQRELAFDETFVKYYFETFDHKLSSWEKYTLSRFLKALDIVIDVVYTNT